MKIDTKLAPLAPCEAAALLGTMPIYLRAVSDAAPDELLRWSPAPAEWCVLEVIGHLIETEERGFGGRIRTILIEERPLFPPWDQSAVAQARRDAERDPDELLEELARRRTEGVALVES